MYIDVTWLGSGAGIVIAGWVFGMVVATLFSIVRRVRT